MVDLKKAKEIIKKVHSGFNMVTEYPNVFLFWHDGEDEVIGGADAPKGVLKANGAVLSMPQLTIKGMLNDDKIIMESKVDFE